MSSSNSIISVNRERPDLKLSDLEAQRLLCVSIRNEMHSSPKPQTPRSIKIRALMKIDPWVLKGLIDGFSCVINGQDLKVKGGSAVCVSAGSGYTDPTHNFSDLYIAL